MGGADTLIGGNGNDIYVVESASDVVTESGTGTDTVQSSITYTLGSNLENLTLTGVAVIDGTGNSLNNVIVGNSANNTLNGGAGADSFVGGSGSETVTYETAAAAVRVNFGPAPISVKRPATPSAT